MTDPALRNQDKDAGGAAGQWWPGPLAYSIAFVAYVLLGMEVHWLLSWTRGLAFALLAVWAIPYYVRGRLRRRR